MTMGDRIRLTKRFVDWVHAQSAISCDVFHWDVELPRLGLRRKRPRPDHTPGTISYLIQYRNREGIRRRYTIGNANAIAPDEARRIARNLLSRIDDPRERHDPVAAKNEERQATTFREIVEAYQTSEGWLSKAQSTRDVEQGLIGNHLLPLLGNRHAREISRRDMEQVFQAIRDCKTAANRPSEKVQGRIRVRGGVGIARRTLKLASPIFAYAVDQAIVPSNPCVGLELGSSGTRDTIVEDEVGYARLFRAIAELEAERQITGSAGVALRLIALTGARRGEIVNLRGRHLESSRQRIILASNEQKAKRRTGRPKIISLPAAAVAILTRLTNEIEPDQLVIRSARPGAPISLQKPWAKVRDRAGLPRSLTIHGLRHSIGSHLAMDGASAPQIQAALGHANIASSVRYIHFAEARKKSPSGQQL
jgi:integrase